MARHAVQLAVCVHYCLELLMLLLIYSLLPGFIIFISLLASARQSSSASGCWEWPSRGCRGTTEEPSLRRCEEQAGSHSSPSRRPVRTYEAGSASGRKAEECSRCVDAGKYCKLKSVDTGEYGNLVSWHWWVWWPEVSWHWWVRQTGQLTLVSTANWSVQLTLVSMVNWSVDTGEYGKLVSWHWWVRRPPGVIQHWWVGQPEVNSTISQPVWFTSLRGEVSESILHDYTFKRRFNSLCYSD